jgi:DNA-binding NtrC family response regulator
MNNKDKILIADLGAPPNGDLCDMLASDGYEIFRSADAGTAIDLIRSDKIAALIADSRISCRDGTSLDEYVTEHFPDIPVILLNFIPVEGKSLPVMYRRAFCYFEKQPDYLCLKGVLARAIEQCTLKKEVATLKSRLNGENIRSRIIGNTPEMVKIFDIIDAVKDSDSSILISGESGSGKELIARTINSCGERGGPFIAFNCAAMPKELIETELFGWGKGIFPGVLMRKAGKCEEAASGTLFLDEIGDLELSLQAKLFSVVREQKIGFPEASAKAGAEFRLISSTKRDLRKEVKNGNFSEDLFYRIKHVEIAVPPLRERREDIPLLFSAFINEFCAREKKTLTISEKVLKALEDYPWPGNVRQLRNVAESAVVIAAGGKITPRELPGEIFSLKRTVVNSNSLKTLRELEKDALRNALQACNGNKSMACRILGISRKAMYRLLKECQF